MTQTVPDISPLMPMHQDPLLVLCLTVRPPSRASREGSSSAKWGRTPAELIQEPMLGLASPHLHGSFSALSHYPEIPCWAIIVKMRCSSCQQQLSTDFRNDTFAICMVWLKLMHLHKYFDLVSVFIFLNSSQLTIIFASGLVIDFVSRRQAIT